MKKGQKIEDTILTNQIKGWLSRNKLGENFEIHKWEITNAFFASGDKGSRLEFLVDNLLNGIFEPK